MVGARQVSPVRQVAFVRNIMVGRRGLTRDVLLHIFATAGARETRSYIATGNFAFSAPVGSVEAIVQRIEAGIEQVLGHREEVFIRSVDALHQLDQARPFATASEAGDHYRAVTFVPDGCEWTGALPSRVPRGDLEIISASGPNIFAVINRIDAGMSSPHSLVERTLKVRATTRNWNTIERILRAEGLNEE